ncbi:MAG: Card1-like endonuclease domain-containing protein [Saprospiraceae bacterium]
MRVLVSLISDQSIPNLLFIRSWPAFERYLFITTRQMEQKGRCDDLIRVAGLPQYSVQNIEVLPESLNDVQAKLEALQLSQSAQYIVHLTGGNKIMALGAYQFFVTRKSEMYYAPIGANGYEKVFPRTDEEVIPFAASVSLQDYLSVYGVRVESAQSQISRPEALAARFFNQRWAKHPTFRNLMQYLGSRSGQSQSIPIADVNGLQERLASIGFATAQSGSLNADEIQWLTGGWFEEFVFQKIKNKLGLADQAIALNVKVRQKGSPNEFDVMFVHNNDLHVVECKSRLTKDMFDQTAYKLAAIKKDLGLQARSYLFASENYYDKRTGQIYESACLRAEHLNIRIRGRDDILNDQLL